MVLRRHFQKRLSGHHRRSRRLLIRLFGRHRVARQLWDFHRRSVRGGLCLGVFVGFTPTIPFHMLIAGVAAVFLRVNIPMAMLACWVSNPITVGPIYWYGDKIGHAILEHIPVTVNWVHIDPGDGTFDKIVSHSLSITVGCVLMGTVAAALTWLASGLITRMLGIVHHKPAENPSIPPSLPGPEGSNPNSPG